MPHFEHLKQRMRQQNHDLMQHWMQRKHRFRHQKQQWKHH